jgi:hypothetical protein
MPRSITAVPGVSGRPQIAAINYGAVEVRPCAGKTDGHLYVKDTGTSRTVSYWRNDTHQWVDLIGPMDNDGKITSMVLTGDISVGAITCTSLTAGSGTITGALMRTSASGQRVEISSADTIDFYDTGGTKVSDIDVTSSATTWTAAGSSGFSHACTNALATHSFSVNSAVKLQIGASVFNVFNNIDVGDNNITSVGQIELASLISAATDIECYDSLVPNGTHDLGTEAVRWSNMYISSVVMSGAAVLEDRAAIAAQATHAIVHCVVNGSGKQELRCQFATGAVQVLATEP